MDMFRTIAAWVLFLAMAVAAAFFWQQSAARSKRIAVLTEAVEQMDAQILTLNEDVTALRRQVEEAEATIASFSLEEDVPLPSEEAAPDESASEASSIDMGAILGALGEKAQPESGMAEAFRSMFKGPQGEQFLESSVSMAMNMQYRDFLNSLPPESVEAVREILNENMTHAARVMMNFFDEDADHDALRLEVEAAQAGMIEELTKVIGADGAAAFQQYEEELPGKMLNDAMDMQLRMFASSLDEETRDYVREVLVEELLPYQQPTTGTIPNPADMGATVSNQQQAYDRALERLTTELDEEQIKAVQDYVQQQKQILGMAESMMGPLINREGENQP